jgi:reticulon-4-interacting protein 1, mitochondrial
MTMRAVYLTDGWCTPGTVAERICVGEIPVPAGAEDNGEGGTTAGSALAPNKVVVEVRASAINVDDVAMAQDAAGGGWFFHGKTPTRSSPWAGGMEYAGVVLAVGTAVATGSNPLQVGDRVCGLQDRAVGKHPGVWCERTVALAKHVVKVPKECDEMSFVQLASCSMGAMVSGDMYRRAKLPRDGDRASRCLVVGASGGLGTFMLSVLAAHKGKQPPHVTGVCSGKHADLVKRLGAAEVIDYTQGDFAEQLVEADAFDVVFDFVGGLAVERSAKRVLKRGGKFITAVGPARAVGDKVLSCCEWYSWACSLTCRLLGSSCCCCCTRHIYDMGGGMPPLKTADFTAAVVDAGARAEVAMEVPFEEAAIREALRRVASRHTGGKVVINMEALGAENMEALGAEKE